MKNVRKKLDAARLWDYALKSVGQRAQTAAELRRKLAVRAERGEDVDPTLAKLKEYGLLDDQRFADTFAASRLENHGFGQARVLRDLRQRRVAPRLAEKAVHLAYAQSDEVALIETYIRRKFRSTPRETLFREDKDLASAFRRLRMAGFTPGKIIEVLKRFSQNPGLLDAWEEPEAE